MWKPKEIPTAVRKAELSLFRVIVSNLWLRIS